MRTISTLIALLVLTGCLLASDHKARGRSAWAWAAASVNESPSTLKTEPPTLKKSPETENRSPSALSTGSDDALDEVNAYRAKRGLPPFKHDPQLTIAAKRAAETRAKALWDGHLANDFACLPDGAKADAAGCGALEDSWGWGTCCADDNYSHAGAAWVRGSDGRRFMHLFVRNGEPATTTKTTTIEPPVATGEVLTCTSGICGTVQQSSRIVGRRRR